MSEILETVTIKTASGKSRRINKSDFEPEIHELYDGKTTIKDESSTDDTPSDPIDFSKLMVSQAGKKFKVVDESGQDVQIKGINKTGYNSEMDAWQAIGSLKTE